MRCNLTELEKYIDFIWNDMYCFMRYIVWHLLWHRKRQQH